MTMKAVFSLVLAVLVSLCSCDHMENVDLEKESPDRAYGPPSFVDNGDGTITDASSNGLMWQKCLAGQPYVGGSCDTSQADTTYRKPWASAPCGGDWRLPSREELHTLTTGTYGIFYKFGSLPTDNLFWSSSHYAGDMKYAVSVVDGGSAYNFNQSNSLYVRCVKTIKP